MLEGECIIRNIVLCFYQVVCNPRRKARTNPSRRRYAERRCPKGEMEQHGRGTGRSLPIRLCGGSAPSPAERLTYSRICIKDQGNELTCQNHLPNQGGRWRGFQHLCRSKAARQRAASDQMVGLLSAAGYEPLGVLSGHIMQHYAHKIILHVYLIVCRSWLQFMQLLEALGTVTEVWDQNYSCWSMSCS